MAESKSLRQWARDSVVLALAEVAIVAGLFVADVYHHIFFSKTPYLFFLAWASLRLRGMRWKEVGFERPRSWGRAFGVGIAVGLAMEVLELFVTQPLLARWIGKMPDLSDFADLVGNVKLLIGICRLEKAEGGTHNRSAQYPREASSGRYSLFATLCTLTNSAGTPASNNHSP